MAHKGESVVQWNPASNDVDHTSAWTSLRQAMLARNVTLAGLGLAALVFYAYLASASPAVMTAGAVVLLASVNLATAWRLRHAWPVTEREVQGQIALDVVALAALFYFVGGATNPFVDLMLMPLAIAAARLPRRHALMVAFLALALYLLLTAIHVPLPSQRVGVNGFDCVGAWVRFAVCAGFVGYLVHSMAGHSREHERKLRQARQKNLNEEYLMRAGSLAAGAAHEIGSPLCTMAVLVNELQQQPQDRASSAQSLRLISSQIDVCRRILSELMSYGQNVLDGDQARSVPVDRFIHDVVEKWRLLRPGVTLACRRQGTQPAPRITTDRGLGHALLNLLNNAADASPRAVEMACTWTSTELRVLVLDRGPGIAPELSRFLGERFLTTKRDKGTGIGLLLAKTTIERAGGSLKLENRPDGGACAEIVVPIIEDPEVQAQPEAKQETLTPPLAVRFHPSQAGRA